MTLDEKRCLDLDGTQGATAHAKTGSQTSGALKTKNKALTVPIGKLFLPTQSLIEPHGTPFKIPTALDAKR